MGSGGKDNSEDRPKRKPGRVPTSCAECRRLKLRCDRKVPCEKCVSRGCGSICPNGALTPGKNNRMILANTEELHDRIEHLGSRIHELESALRSLQESVSDKPHPLLEMGVIEAKTEKSIIYPHRDSQDLPKPSSSAPQTHQITESTFTRTDEESILTDSFGTLSIGHQGGSHYFGRTARPEHLILEPTHPEHKSDFRAVRDLKLIVECAGNDGGGTKDEFDGEIVRLLPSLSEATALCELYLDYGKFLYNSLTRQELFDETLLFIYRSDSFNSILSRHTLSLLFIILAIATLFDPNKKPFSDEAHEFYCISRICLDASPSSEGATLMSVQSLIHMAQYIDFIDSDSSRTELPWIHMGNAIRLGFSIGLHVNASHWKLPEKSVQRRNRAFWQLFVQDTCSSLSYGRPPSISMSFIDYTLPNEFQVDDQSLTYSAWKTRYATLLHHMLTTAYGSRQPPYSTILDLDRRVRDFPVPLLWRSASEKNDPMTSPELYIQRWLVLSSKESALLNLHKAYFAQALTEQPVDLSKHRFVPSVIAIYRSAYRLSRGMRLAWDFIPQFISRLSGPWSQVLSAAIVICTICTKSPTSHLAPPAFQELDFITKLFDRAAESGCPSAKKLLRTIHCLHQSAFQHLGQPRGEDPVLTSAELDRFAGKTYLMSKEFSSKQFGKTRSRSRSTSITLSDIAELFGPSVIPENMHPTIAQDIRDFELRGPVLQDADTSLFDFPTEGFDTSQFQVDFSQPSHYFSAPPVFNQMPIDNCNQPPVENVYSHGPLMLDSAWQGFVEQLGF